MKVLLVHNHYRTHIPSGENRVFELERSLLESNGHEVRTFERHSDSLAQGGLRALVKGAALTPWNPWSARELKEEVIRFKPDVVHAHNTFPLISPSVFPAARGSARVLTLHNYRLFCPAGVPMRLGRVCTDCLDARSAWPSIKHGCYRDSRLATIPIAANVELHRLRKTFQNDVEALIALTEFQRSRMVEAGLPAAKTFVKPNFFPGSPAMVPWEERSNQVVFAGRLSAEKGVAGLLDAWRRWPDAPPLLILGDGPLRNELEMEAAADGLNVRFMGNVDPDHACRLIGESKLLVVPSTWFEGFPMVLREAFALGTPSLVSDCGSLPEIVEGGVGEVFEAGNVDALATCLKNLWLDEDRLEGMSGRARLQFENKYNEEANYRTLMQIYDHAIAAVRKVAA